MTDEFATLEARLAEIGRPSGFMSGPTSWPPARRIEQARRELREWEAAHPELAAEHQRVRARLDQLEALKLEQQQDAAERERVDLAMLASGAGEKSIAAAMSPRETPALALVRDWLKSGKTFLLLTGSPRTGKSVAAAYAMRRALENHRTVLLIRAAEESRCSGYGPEAEARLKLLRRVGLLVIDDMATEMLGEVWKQTLDDVIDARHEGKLRTVITTNLDTPTFMKRYGIRIEKRIEEDGLKASAGNVPVTKRGAP